MISVLTRAASIADDGDFDLYNPADDPVADADDFLTDLQKRMGCPRGYTYQAILKDCVPSLGVSTYFIVLLLTKFCNINL